MKRLCYENPESANLNRLINALKQIELTSPAVSEKSGAGCEGYLQAEFEGQGGSNSWFIKS